MEQISSKHKKKNAVELLPGLLKITPTLIYFVVLVRKMAQAEICEKCAAHLEICTNLGIENKSILRFN
jgi:hypothetical protein